MPNIKDFLLGQAQADVIGDEAVDLGRMIDLPPYIDPIEEQANKKVFVETYGCQMNVSDSEVVMAVLKANNYEMVNTAQEANVLLINTCAIRGE